MSGARSRKGVEVHINIYDLEDRPNEHLNSSSIMDMLEMELEARGLSFSGTVIDTKFSKATE